MKSAFIHLRIPFSIFLMPMFWLGLSVVPAGYTFWDAFWVFVALHLFIYPASNGFNSYYDRDEGPIGGLASPPPVSPLLLRLSLWWNVPGLFIIMQFGWLPFALVSAYVLVSMAYSHTSIRLKGSLLASSSIVPFFQGPVVVALVYASLAHGLGWVHSLAFPAVIAVFSFLLLLGSYPLTQVYQIEEDTKRGDKTLAAALGVKGTIVWSAAFFGAAANVLSLYCIQNGFNAYFNIIIAGMALPTLYFGWWVYQIWRNPAAANHASAMTMNKVSGLSLSAALAYYVVFLH